MAVTSVAQWMGATLQRCSRTTYPSKHIPITNSRFEPIKSNTHWLVQTDIFFDRQFMHFAWADGQQAATSLSLDRAVIFCQQGSPIASLTEPHRSPFWLTTTRSRDSRSRHLAVPKLGEASKYNIMELRPSSRHSATLLHSLLSVSPFDPLP